MWAKLDTGGPFAPECRSVLLTSLYSARGAFIHLFKRSVNYLTGVQMACLYPVSLTASIQRAAAPAGGLVANTGLNAMPLPGFARLLLLLRRLLRRFLQQEEAGVCKFIRMR